MRIRSYYQGIVRVTPRRGVPTHDEALRDLQQARITWRGIGGGERRFR